MRAECLPNSSLPHPSKLALDHTYHFDRVEQFYSEPPRSADWILSHRPAGYDEGLRAPLVAVLQRQNRANNAPQAVLDNIARLHAGAAAVVTGQQVGLFGGPLFSFYKALHALMLAAEFTRAGVECVPVFWLASEDHDLEEVDHVVVRNGDALRTIRVNVEGATGAPVGELRFTNLISAAVDEAVAAIGDGEVAEILRECYTPGQTFSTAFARLLTKLF